MIQWVLIGELFGVLARATGREEVAPAIPRWLSMIQAFIERGNATKVELNALKAQIVQMVNEGREPTDEEWSALQARSDAAHDAIQSADLSDDDDPEPIAVAAVNALDAEAEPVDPAPPADDGDDDDDGGDGGDTGTTDPA